MFLGVCLVFYTASQRFHNLGYKVKSDLLKKKNWEGSPVLESCGQKRFQHNRHCDGVENVSCWVFFITYVFTWGVVLSDLHIVSRASISILQAEIPIAKSEVVSCGSLQVPLTTGAIRIVGAWEAWAVDHTPLTYVGASTCCCEEFELQNQNRALK